MLNWVLDMHTEKNQSLGKTAMHCTDLEDVFGAVKLTIG